jgi:hypothetical protein
VQAHQKSSQFTQYVRLVGEKNEVIGPPQLNYPRTRHAALKVLDALPDPVQIGSIDLLNGFPLSIALHLMSLQLILDGRRKRNECKHGHCDARILWLPRALDDRVTDTTRCSVLANSTVGRRIKIIAQFCLGKWGAVGPPLPFPVRLERSQI